MKRRFFPSKNIGLVCNNLATSMQTLVFNGSVNDNYKLFLSQSKLCIEEHFFVKEIRTVKKSKLKT